MERRLAAILAADVAGYSRLMSDDEEVTLATLNSYRNVIEKLVADHRGRVFGSAGDSVVAEFASAVVAVQCAVDIQRKIEAANTDLPEPRRMRFRIGVNLGDVMAEGDNLFGDGVNVAARVQELAVPGGVSVSANVFEQVEGKLELDWRDTGAHAVKNIAKPVRVYQAMVDAQYGENRVAATLSTRLEKPSIAVLPFVNMSGDSEQEYFSDGITEDIITALSRLRWFFVIARNSSFVYKGRAVDIKQVGRELGVRYLLEGSVRRAGNRIRVAAQLVDAATGTHHWAQNFDRDLTDLFELQDDITQSVTAAIEPRLVAAEVVRSQNRVASDLDAWELVMRALAHYWKMTAVESETAIEMLREAVRTYPNYGPAHSMLAFALLVSGHVGWILDSQDEAFAAELARRSAEIDDEDPWAHLALGYVAFMQRRTDEAVREHLRAIELNPNFATAYGYLGWSLVFDGQSDAALGYLEQALRMSPYDPFNAFFYAGSAGANYFAHRYDEAIVWARKAIRTRPGFAAAQRIYCASLGQAGETDEARMAMARLLELQPNISAEWIEQHVPYTERAMPHFLDGMRKAGLA